MRRRNSNFKKRIAIIFLFVFVLTLGFAYLMTTLNIIGSAFVHPNEWNIYFDVIGTNVSEGVTVQRLPELGQNRTTILDSYTLSKPGDYAEVTIRVRNEGTIDAMIGSFTLLFGEDNEMPSYLSFFSCYEGGAPLELNQVLKAHSSRVFTILLCFRSDISEDQLPDTPQSFSHVFGINYVMADENASDITTVYSYDEAVVKIGEPLPDGIHTFDNPSDAMKAYGYPYCVRHEIFDGEVVASSLVFEYDDTIYDGNFQYGWQYYKKNKDFIENLCEGGNSGILPISDRFGGYVFYYQVAEQDLAFLLGNEGSIQVGYDKFCYITSHQSVCSTP